MPSFSAGDNLLGSASLQVWDELVTAVGPASLLVLIEARMSGRLRALHSAEDVLQDALLHAWRDRASFTWGGLRSFRAWLISIIDHRIHDLADHAAARKRGGGIWHHRIDVNGDGRSRDAAVMMASTTPSRIALYREQAAAMEAALAELPDEVRDVVRLRLFEQLSIGAIAAHLDIGEGAVRHRLRRGARLYHRRLQEALITRSGRTSPSALLEGGDASFLFG